MERRKVRIKFVIHLVGWELISHYILDEQSAEKNIFKQELQKRRRIKVKAKILKQASIRSMGRRAGCMKVNSSSPLNFNKLFAESRKDYGKRKTEPFGT